MTRTPASCQGSGSCWSYQTITTTNRSKIALKKSDIQIGMRVRKGGDLGTVVSLGGWVGDNQCHRRLRDADGALLVMRDREVIVRGYEGGPGLAVLWDRTTPELGTLRAAVEQARYLKPAA